MLAFYNLVLTCYPRGDVSSHKMIKEIESRDPHLKIKTLDLVPQVMKAPKGEDREG